MQPPDRPTVSLKNVAITMKFDGVMRSAMKQIVF